MLEILDRDLRKVAVLHNAFGVEETLALNGVNRLKFSLPEDDPKNAFCRAFFFVHDGDGQYYRILSSQTVTNEVGASTYEAEHGIATLVDDLMFQTTILGGTGMYTREVIEHMLARQTERRWQLGACAFEKQFEYGFSCENLLNALFSVPNLFVEPYKWTYDFTTRPWTVNLERIDTEAQPDFYVRAGKNLIASSLTRTNADICTRLYLLGYGEGDNQLTIRDVNGGIPYLQSPQAYIDQYGVISRTYVDRQFEDAESLMERGRALLAVMQEPQYARDIDVADLYPLTGQEIDLARVGDMVRLTLDGSTAYVTGITRNLDVAGDMKVELSTQIVDLADQVADMADRQRIEQVYSQGATQIYGQSVQANADASTPAELNFYLPAEMRIVNKVVAKIRLERFRSYSRVTGGGGKNTTTSSAGGGAETTSKGSGNAQITSGPSSKVTTAISSTWSGNSNVSQTAESSGAVTGNPTSGRTGSTVSESISGIFLYTSPSPVSIGGANGMTGSSGGSTGAPSTTNTGAVIGDPGKNHVHTLSGHTHSMGSHYHSLGGHTHDAGTHSHLMEHTHVVPGHSHSIGNHYHDVIAHRHDMYHQHYIDHSHDISHTHTVTVSSHTHTVQIPAHTHTVEIPDHTHTIEQGIFRFGNPKSARIMINGTEKLTMSEEREIDLTPYLLGSGGKIPRGAWIRLGVLPDDLAYIIIDIFVQGFVQSRGGGTY